MLFLIFCLPFFLLGIATQWPERPTFRMALLDAIAAARATQQDVYTAMGYTQSQWSKMMRGEIRLPNFDRFESLPPAVWDELLPRVAYVVWVHRQRQHKQEVA